MKRETTAQLAAALDDWAIVRELGGDDRDLLAAHLQLSQARRAAEDRPEASRRTVHFENRKPSAVVLEADKRKRAKGPETRWKPSRETFRTELTDTRVDALVVAAIAQGRKSRSALRRHLPVGADLSACLERLMAAGRVQRVDRLVGGTGRQQRRREYVLVNGDAAASLRQVCFATCTPDPDEGTPLGRRRK